jgi:membrane protein DedA with SNARE-associated domain
MALRCASEQPEMISKIIEYLSGFIIAVISGSGYAGILLLMAIESACIPLPSEVIMPFSGYLVYTGRFSLFWVATVGALGCNLGSLVAYYVGYYGGRPLVERYGSYIFLSEKELHWADQFFLKWGDGAVFVSRLLPVVRTFIALPAGIARMRQVRFHVFTFVGSWPWCFVLAWIGMRLGEKWDKDPRLKEWFHRFDAVILAVIVIGVVWFVWSRWKHRIKSSQ